MVVLVLATTGTLAWFLSRDTGLERVRAITVDQVNRARGAWNGDRRADQRQCIQRTSGL